MTLRRTVHALPTLFRVGFADMVAYRVEFVIWMLTSTMPLIMLALMSAVAAEAPIEGYGAGDFTAYYLMVLLVRQFTGSWVVWELTEHIKRGTLAFRLLRPVPALVMYATENLSAIPLRGLVAIPLTAALLVFAGAEHLALAPEALAMTLASVFAAWLMTFFLNAMIACLAFFIESAISVHQVYYGLFTVFSGYLLPLDLFPEGLQGVTRYLPFRFQMSLPVDLALGRLQGTEALQALGLQYLWVLALGAGLTLLWKTGLRRYESFGG